VRVKFTCRPAMRQKMLLAARTLHNRVPVLVPCVLFSSKRSRHPCNKCVLASTPRSGSLQPFEERSSVHETYSSELQHGFAVEGANRHRESYPRFLCSASGFTSEVSDSSKISDDKYAFRFQAILSVLRTTASRAQYVESTPANQTMGSCASFVITKKAPLSQQWANEVSAPESLSKGYRLSRDNNPEVAVRGMVRTVKLSYFSE